MIQYINKLQDKDIKIKITQSILNILTVDDIKIRNHSLLIRKTTINIDSCVYYARGYITSRSVIIKLESKKYISQFRLISTGSRYALRYRSSMYFDSSFVPSKEDLYNILFNTNKRMHFILKSNDSKLLQYVLSYAEKKKENK